MNEQGKTTQTTGEHAAQERCMCRETLDHLRECFGISPEVRQHLTNSRLEFLKAIRAIIDARIEHISHSGGQRGTKVAVE
jgi:hypothetical protein